MNKDDMLERIEAGTMSYEDAADLFLGTLTGKGAGVDRATLLVKLRQNFPTEAALGVFLRKSLASFTVALDQARTDAPPGATRH